MSINFRNNRSGVLVLLGASLSHMFNDGLPQIQVALVPVFMKEFKLSLIQVGFLVSIPLICGTIAILFAGLLADRMNHIHQIVIAHSLICASSIMVGLTRDVITLAIFLSLVQVGNNLFHPAGFSLASKVMQTERRTTALGFFNAGGIMGFAFGPLSVGALLGLWEWRSIYFLWAVLLMINIVYMLTLRSINAKTQK